MKRGLSLAATLSVAALGVLIMPRLLSSGDAQSVPQEPSYYVAKRDCSDHGPGSALQPFCSIQRGVDKLRAGDTLQIGSGKYRGRVTVSRSGVAGAPIVVSGAPGSRVVIDGRCRSFPCPEPRFPNADDIEPHGIVINDKDHVTLRNLTVRNVLMNGISADDTTGLTIEGVTVTRTGMSGINVYDSTGIAIRNSGVTRSNLGIRRRNGGFMDDEESITIVNSRDFDIAYNDLHDSLKEGIDIKVGSRGGAVHHNEVTRMCAVGIYLNEAHDVNVYRNRIVSAGFFKRGRRILRCSSLPTYGRLMGKYFGDGVLLAVGDLGNLSKGKLSSIRVYRNVVSKANLNCVDFWDELKESGRRPGKMTDVRIENNTLDRCGRNGIGAGIRLDDASKTSIVNNIMAHNAEAGVTGNAVRNNAISHNLFFRTGRTAGTTKVLGDPLFVSSKKGDFHLRQGSPAIDAGTEVGLPSSGSAPDLGAYEHGMADD